MKKFAMLIATVVASTGLNSAPVGNTSAPELIQEGFFIPCDSSINFRIGYEGDFVADGRMKQHKEGHGRVDSYEQDTNSATVTLNILDRVDVYGVFGSSKTSAEWRFTDLPAGIVHNIEVETFYSFLWAAGARAIVYEWCNTSLGLGGRYSSSHYHPVWLTTDGINDPAEGARFRWREWQINLDVSYKIDLFTPYIGIKYSNAKTQLNHFLTPIASKGIGSNEFKNRVPVGLYLGCALSTGEYFMLNVEARLIDEDAVTISGDFRF